MRPPSLPGWWNADTASLNLAALHGRTGSSPVPGTSAPPRPARHLLHHPAPRVPSLLGVPPRAPGRLVLGGRVQVADGRGGSRKRSVRAVSGRTRRSTAVAAGVGGCAPEQAVLVPVGSADGRARAEPGQGRGRDVGVLVGRAGDGQGEVRGGLGRQGRDRGRAGVLDVVREPGRPRADPGRLGGARLPARCVPHEGDRPVEPGRGSTYAASTSSPAVGSWSLRRRRAPGRARAAPGGRGRELCRAAPPRGRLPATPPGVDFARSWCCCGKTLEEM